VNVNLHINALCSSTSAVPLFESRDAAACEHVLHLEFCHRLKNSICGEAREAGKPELLITDGLQSYHKAFNKEFCDHHQKSEHVVPEGLTARSNNNKVERLHNTVRERVKVMRGLHSEKSAAKFNEGFKAYYNFVRPNQALGGRTPAEVAGVGLELGKNRWLGLIKGSVEK